MKGLCEAIKEGNGFRNPDPGAVRERDGALDSVAWKAFSDGRVGKLVLFAQCKTGTDWKDEMKQLQPTAFIKTWMKDPFPVDPIRVFCVSEACDGAHWTAQSNTAGIIFDRCRLVDYCDSLPMDLVRQIERWTAAAKKTLPYKRVEDQSGRGRPKT